MNYEIETGVLQKMKDDNKSSFSFLYESLLNKKKSLAVVGLGYVGMPIAVAFANKGIDVIGFDINEDKIALYQSGIDPTKEIGNSAINRSNIYFTSSENNLKKARFIIVAVPTPVNNDHTPNLYPVEQASIIIGRNLGKYSIIVYESTVYPGVTEDVCIPILERESGLRYGTDFKVGYSPEPVSSIKTAEAIKVVENSQRDINIAFMNELAMVFDRMGIDTNEVVDGMNTKWNALGFRPGLVGGHCIGVDPYYFTYEAEKLGYHSQIILNGRIVNDSMGNYVADAAVKKMIEAGQAPRYSSVVILGLTFKENCPDTRNSKVNDIIKRLNSYGINPIVVDPWADEKEAKQEYGIELTQIKDVSNVDCVIVAVAHSEFKQMCISDIIAFYRPELKINQRVLIDVKGLYGIHDLEKSGLNYWRL